MAIAASMRMSLRLSSARRLDTSTIASRPKAVPAMNASFWATGSCLPIGWPHCLRSAAHSRESFSAYLVVAGADRRQRQAAGVERRQRDLQALALAADHVLGRDPKTSLNVVTRVLDAAQAHELVAVRDVDAFDVARADEGGDAALVPVGLRDDGHHDDDVGDHAVGRPQLRAVDGSRSRPRSGSAVVLMRAGSEPTSGSVSRNAEMWVRATFGSHSRFCSSVPNGAAARAGRSTGAPTAASTAMSARCRPTRARGCSRPA